ncbi:MAG: protein TolR [Desulfobacterales bacterium]|nr:protein TolR [Desulfobacterales bacterium]MDD4071637.1 protein TolR [Desulfobacterales bacterium]MDD4391637.1 protein TolR [Desulfobacterales bacterium]
MNSGSNNNQLMSDINVTPFVDVMLVLLIIFMVTAPMMVQGVNVSLPQTTSQPLPANDEALIISIDNKNQIFINDMNVSLDFLQEKLKNILGSNTEKNVYLRADKDISYGMVVRVMSEIKGAGVEKLGMVTDPLDDRKEGAKPLPLVG